MTQPTRQDNELRLRATVLREQLEKYSNLQLWWMSIIATGKGSRYQRSRAEKLINNPTYRRGLIEDLTTDLASVPDKLDRVANAPYLTEDELVQRVGKMLKDETLASKLRDSNPVGVAHCNEAFSTLKKLNNSVKTQQQPEQSQSLKRKRDTAPEFFTDMAGSSSPTDPTTNLNAYLDQGIDMSSQSDPTALDVYLNERYPISQEDYNKLRAAAGMCPPGTTGVPQVVGQHSIPTTGRGPSRTSTQGAGGPSGGGR